MYIIYVWMDGWMDGWMCMYVCMYVAVYGKLRLPLCRSPDQLPPSRPFAVPHPAPTNTQTHTRTDTHTHTHTHTHTQRQTNSACLFHAELKHSPCQHHFLASEHTSELTKKGHDHRTLGVSWSQTVKPKSRELACSNMLRNVASHAKTPRHR